MCPHRLSHSNSLQAISVRAGPTCSHLDHTDKSRADLKATAVVPLLSVAFAIVETMPRLSILQ